MVLLELPLRHAELVVPFFAYDFRRHEHFSDFGHIFHPSGTNMSEQIDLLVDVGSDEEHRGSEYKLDSRSLR